MFHSFSKANKRTGDSNQFLLKNTQAGKPSWPGCKHWSYWEVWISTTTWQFPVLRDLHWGVCCLFLYVPQPFFQDIRDLELGHTLNHTGRMSLIQINSSISTRNILGWENSPVLLLGQDNFFHSNTVIFMKSITPKSITQKETRIPQHFKLFKQKFQRSQKTRCSEHHCHTYLFEKVFTHL